MLVPVQAVAIGCYHHLCRGEVRGRDELFKIMLKRLSRFYVDIPIRLEGGRVTPLTRAKAALKQAIQRKRRRKSKPGINFLCGCRSGK